MKCAVKLKIKLFNRERVVTKHERDEIDILI